MTFQTQPATFEKPRLTPVGSRLLQRRCTCGGTAGPDGECAACRAKRLRAASASPAAARSERALAGSGGEFALSTLRIHSRGGSGGPLEVSEPGDPAEREAEGIVERLFPSSSPADGGPFGRAGRVSLSPPAALARRSHDGGGGRAPCTQCGSTGRLPGGVADRGEPLPASTRAEMERAFGADFSSVRVHTNGGAAQLSRGLKAQAFTYGEHIFFDHGRYDPESAQGKRLLAHELTHTVQQRDTIAMLARQGGGRTTLQCVNENLSSAGVAAWLLAIVGTTCGLIFGIAGSPTGPGAAGTAAFGAALCIAGVIGASVGAVLGVISGCWSDPNFRSRGAYLSAAGGGGAPAGGTPAGATPTASA
jgi:Domain of unknown function (DUF4157)